MKTKFASVLLLCLFSCLRGDSSAQAAKALDVSTVSSSVLMVHIVGGTARHETLGSGIDGSVDLQPLDSAKAALPKSYSITSADDANYKTAQHPQAVGRKSKGREFVNANYKYLYVPEHWIFLRLSKPLLNGKSYKIDLGDLVSANRVLTMKFDERATRSEAIHVNQVGYRPDANKYAYLSMWLGDLGPQNFDEFIGKPFHLLDDKTGKTVFSGKVELRRRVSDGPESAQTDLPGQSKPYAGTDVWQCDFSSFKTPGRYRVSIPGVGASFPFAINADVYRQPAITVLRGLFHQRCHTALDAKHTEHPRAACHTAEQSKFLQTTHRNLDKAYNDGKQKDVVETTDQKRTVTFGWHDAGDWDHEAWHTEAIQTLLFAYELAPQNWRDGESNIPESGNGIPDILDEAIWAANLYPQLQREDGGVSSGTFADWWPRAGETSTTDSMTYYVYAPDPRASLRWAALGARLSWILPRFKQDKKSSEYLQRAIKAWNWSEKNLREGDEAKIRDDRCHAAAALFQATGEQKYLDAFKRDFQITKGKGLTEWQKYDQRYAAWTYAFCDRPNRDVELQKIARDASLKTADEEFVETAARRAFRKGYNWWRGMYWGAGSSPDGLPLIIAHALSKDSKYLRVLENNCDMTLGTNPLNMTWVTGIGARSPREILRIEDWYAPWTKPDAPMNPVPGIFIYGPHVYAGDLENKDSSGPWDVKWNQATTYPHASKWPGYELYFENRHNAMMGEFTVSDLATVIASFGYLRAPAK